jgi:hypothetical protein
MHLSKEAKRQNLRALKLLFGYLKIPGRDLEEQSQVFLDIAREGVAARRIVLVIITIIIIISSGHKIT